MFKGLRKALCCSTLPLLASMLLSTPANAKPINCVGAAMEHAEDSKPSPMSLMFDVDRNGSLWFGSQSQPIFSRINYPIGKTTFIPSNGGGTYVVGGTGLVASGPYKGAAFSISASLNLSNQSNAFVKVDIGQGEQRRTVAFVSNQCN